MTIRNSYIIINRYRNSSSQIASIEASKLLPKRSYLGGFWYIRNCQTWQGEGWESRTWFEPHHEIPDIPCHLMSFVPNWKISISCKSWFSSYSISLPNGRRINQTLLKNGSFFRFKPEQSTRISPKIPQKNPKNLLKNHQESPKKVIPPVHISLSPRRTLPLEPSRSKAYGKPRPKSCCTWTAVFV